MDCVALTGDQVFPMIEDMILDIMGQHRFQFLVWLFPIIEDGFLKKQLRQKKSGSQLQLLSLHHLNLYIAL